VPKSSGEVTVKEGRVRIKVPRSGIGGPRGPAQKGPVFYNPAMVLCRDVAVALIATLPERRTRYILDGLGGTGVRGLRIATESNVPYKEVIINDIQPAAFKAIERNIELNDVHNVTARRRHLNSLVHDETFTYIDIDPYGSPGPFLDSAIQGAGRGVLGVTATDTAALCGSSRDACLRRYGAKATRSHFMHEAGLRILIGAIVRHAARYDKAASPMLAHATDHYMRVYISLEKGAIKAKARLDMLGHTVLHTNGSFETGTEDDGMVLAGLPSKTRVWGPLWTGPLHDIKVLDKMEVPDSVGKKRTFEKALGLWRGEVSFGPMFYDIDELCRRLNPEPPKMRVLFKKISDQGYKVASTQFSPKGFKTDMPFAELEELMRHI